MSDDRWDDEQQLHEHDGLPARFFRPRPQLPSAQRLKAPLVTAEEIFGWLRGTFQPRMGIVERDPKSEKPPRASMGTDLTQAKALALEFEFSPEECERVLIVAKRDEQLARQMLQVAAAMGGPNPIGDVCFDVAELKKRIP